MIVQDEEVPSGETTPDILEELPFPGRRSRPIHEKIADPLGGEQFSSLAETPPQHEVYARAENSRRRGGSKLPVFPTLETMYAAFPDVARIGKLRIVRVHPQWWADPYTGQRIRMDGILSYQDSPRSTREIEEVYGGYKFNVFGMLEQVSRDNEGGPPKLVDVAMAEFTIPREPIADQRPLEDGEMMTGQWPFYGGRRGGGPMPQQMSSGDVAPILTWAERMMNSRNGGGNGGSNGGSNNHQAPSDSVFQTMARQGEMTAQQVREMAQRQIDSLERQNQMLVDRISSMEGKMSDRPSDIVSLTQAVAALNQSSRSSVSSDEARVMREQHDRETSRMQEEHARDLDRLTRDRDREVDRARVDAEARVERAEERLRELRESFERKERDLRDDFDRRERSFRDEAKRQLEIVKTHYDTRIEEIRQLHDREMRLHQSMQENTSKTAETAHAIELRALQGEVARLVADISQKQLLVDEHMAERNKPLVDQVNEIKTMAETLGLISDKEDAPLPIPVGEQAPLYEKLLTVLASQADKILPQLTALVKKPEGQAPMPVQQQQMVMQQQQQRAALPPRRQQRMTFSDSEGPSMVNAYEGLYGPPVTQQEREDMGPHSYAATGPVPFNPPAVGDARMPPNARRVVMAPAQQQQPPQPMQQIVPAAEAPQPQPQPILKPEPPMQAAADVVKPAAVPDVEPWSGFGWIPLPKEEVVGLATTLMQACSQKVEPEALVKAFVDQHGVETVSMIPAILDVTRFIEAVRTDPATRSTVLATGRGKRYLEDVWACIVKQGEKMTEASRQEEESSKPSEG